MLRLSHTEGGGKVRRIPNLHVKSALPRRKRSRNPVDSMSGGPQTLSGEKANLLLLLIELSRSLGRPVRSLVTILPTDQINTQASDFYKRISRHEQANCEPLLINVCRLDGAQVRRHIVDNNCQQPIFL